MVIELSNTTAVFERPPSQADVHLCNRLPNLFKDAPTLTAFITRLKSFLTSQELENIDELFADRTLYRLACERKHE